MREHIDKCQSKMLSDSDSFSDKEQKQLKELYKRGSEKECFYCNKKFKRLDTHLNAQHQDLMKKLKRRKSD